MIAKKRKRGGTTSKPVTRTPRTKRRVVTKTVDPKTGKRTKDVQRTSRDGSRVVVKNKTVVPKSGKGFFNQKTKKKSKVVLSNSKGTDDYKYVKAKTSSKIGPKMKNKSKAKAKGNSNVAKIVSGIRNYKRPTGRKRST